MACISSVGARRRAPSVSQIGPGMMEFDADAVAAPFDRKHAREHIDAGLGGADMGLHRLRMHGLGRGDIDDVGARLLQELMRGAQHIEGAEQIDVDTALKAFGGHAKRQRAESFPQRPKPGHRSRRSGRAHP